MDIATLQLEIDSRKAAQARKDLEGLTAAAEKTEAATDSLSKATAEGEDRYKAIARAALERKAALDAEVRGQMSIGGETRKVTAEMQAQVQEYTRVASAEHQARLASERQAKALADAAKAAEQNSTSMQKLLGQIDPMQAKLSRLDDMEKRLTQTYRQGAMGVDTYAVALAKINGQRAEISDVQMKQVAEGADQAASSMEKLGINTSSARYDMMMLGRAAASGNWNQASSSMLQLGTRTNLAGAAARAAINPFTLLAAAAVGVFLLYERGMAETRAYNIALIETGHEAGVTSAQLAGMARNISGTDQVSRAASTALVELVSNARLAGRDIEIAGRATVTMSQATGRSVSEFVNEFKEIRKDPVRALEELNDRYGYLTQATYLQVRALVEEGREQEAVSLVVRTHSEMMDERAPQIAENIGTMARAWRDAKSAVEGYINAASGAISGIGAPRQSGEIQSELEGLLQSRDRVASRDTNGPIKWMQENIPLLAPSAMDGRIAELYDELDQALARETRAEMQGYASKVNKDGLAGERFLDGLVDRSKSDLAKANQIAKTKQAARDAILGYENNPKITDDQRYLGIAAVVEKERIALAEIEKKFKPQGGNKQADVSEYKRNLSALNDAFKNSNQILESERRAGLVDEEAYWQKKIDLIDENEKAQKALMVSELARLSTKKNSAKQIADVEAQMAKVAAQADKDRTVALTDQKAAYDKLTFAVRSYIDALSEQVRVAERAGQLQIAGMGMGPNQRELSGALSGVDDHFAREQVKLTRDLASGKIEASQFQAMLVGLTEQHGAMRDALIRNYDLLRERESEWLTGTREGLNSYADSAANMYGSVASTVNSAFKGMEDALVSFVTTGKLDFKSLADSIIADMARIAIQQSVTGPLAGMLGGMLGAVSGVSNASMIQQAGGDGIGHLISANGWSSGGYTGAGGKHDVAGFVHRDEGVLSKEDIAALGGERGFNQLRSALKRGYSSGGLGSRAPGMVGVPSGNAQAPSIIINSVVNPAPGTNVAEMNAAMDRRDAQIKADIYENLRRNRWSLA